VIIHLFEEYGEECVQRLRGMFVFALWDRRRRSLFLARDRLGIKPLYYAELPGGLVFASELKSLLRFPGLPRDLEPDAVRAYLQFGYVPDPLSIFRRVRKLPPGHVLVVNNGALARLRAYWDPAPGYEAALSHQSEPALVEELRWRLAETVRLRLVSDVPIG